MNKNNNYRLSQVHNYFQRGHKAHSLTVFQPPFNYQFFFFLPKQRVAHNTSSFIIKLFI